MNICVIGGDLRIAYLCEMLAKSDNLLNLYGLEKCEMLKEFNHIENMEQGIEKADLIITAIPLSKDGGNVNAVYTDKIISVEKIFQNIKNKTVITGNITEEINKYIKSDNNIKIVDVMKLEELTVLNAIPTAEGAIRISNGKK